MLQGFKNPKKQGDVGMGIAIGWFATKGYTVSIPLTDSQDYDLIVDIDDVLNRVQVKTTYHQKNGKYQVNLRVYTRENGDTKFKLLDKSKVEHLFILTDCGDKYLIPTDRIGGASGISLGDKYEEFKVK